MRKFSTSEYEKMIEKAARALALADGYDPDGRQRITNVLDAYQANDPDGSFTIEINPQPYIGNGKYGQPMKNWELYKTKAGEIITVVGIINDA